MPTPDGGLRPIGLFPTIVRVWMRTRACVARVWEAANALPRLFGGAGMGAQRAAWQASLRAESAALAADDHVQALLDLTKAFEMVPHQQLVAAAIKRGYSLIILLLTLAAYRLARAIGVDAHCKSLRQDAGTLAGDNLPWVCSIALGKQSSSLA